MYRDNAVALKIKSKKKRSNVYESAESADDLAPLQNGAALRDDRSSDESYVAAASDDGPSSSSSSSGSQAVESDVDLADDAQSGSSDPDYQEATPRPRSHGSSRRRKKKKKTGAARPQSARREALRRARRRLSRRDEGSSSAQAIRRRRFTRRSRDAPRVVATTTDNELDWHEYLPTEWISSTTPKPVPYYPQVRNGASISASPTD